MSLKRTAGEKKINDGRKETNFMEKKKKTFINPMTAIFHAFLEYF